MIEKLEALGFECETLWFEEVRNLWARRGKDGPVFAFAGHTDVVPTGDVSAWKYDPFTPTEEGDLLYGRGTADMKGSIAAMMVAIEDFIAANPDHKGSLALLITADEEGPSVNGTVKVVEHLQARHEHIELTAWWESPPSTDTVGDVDQEWPAAARWVPASPSKASRATWPTRTLPETRSMMRLRPWRKLAGHRMGSGQRFLPGYQFPDLQYQRRYRGHQCDPRHLRSRLQLPLLHRAHPTASCVSAPKPSSTSHGLDYDLQWTLSGQPFSSPTGAPWWMPPYPPFAPSLAVTPSCPPPAGTSDWPFYRPPPGSQVVELGPTNATIHKVDEHTSISELGNAGPKSTPACLKN